jgi:hypothetical protein
MKNVKYGFVNIFKDLLYRASGSCILENTLLLSGGEGKFQPMSFWRKI